LCYPLQVVGEDRQTDPGTGAAQRPQSGAPQPEAALEVADAGLDPDPPVAEAPAPPGPLVLQPRLARGAGVGQPDSLDGKRFPRLVVGGGPEPTVSDPRAR